MDLGVLLPSLRLTLEIERTRHQGQRYLVLRDRLELAGPRALLVPEPLAPLLALLDGRRTALQVAVELEQQLGLAVDAADVLRFVGQLSEALLLDDERLAAARHAATLAYRAAPFRPPALADSVYPADPDALRQYLHRFGWDNAEARADQVAGLISPHIDYGRGGPVYARLWHAAREAARRAEIVVIFGTDHGGGLDRLTLSTTDYATPWGRLPTDVRARDTLTEAIGDEDAFADELHHRTEHSVELAAIWLHFVRDGEPVPIVPILCGPPGNYMAAGELGSTSPAGRAIRALRGALDGRRALAVAAADLAHVGPAFGDAQPFSAEGKAAVRAADEELIAACATGAPAVLRSAGRGGDRFRICGLAPIAWLLELIGPSIPETVAYDQCPADQDGGSLVSIAGVLLRPSPRPLPSRGRGG